MFSTKQPQAAEAGKRHYLHPKDMRSAVSQRLSTHPFRLLCKVCACKPSILIANPGQGLPQSAVAPDLDFATPPGHHHTGTACLPQLVQ